MTREEALTPALSPGEREDESPLPLGEGPDRLRSISSEGLSSLPLPLGEGRGEGGILPLPLRERQRESGILPLPLRERQRESGILPLPLGERQRESGLPPAILARIRELRKNPTPAEHLLWQILRGRQLLGKKFRRQHPIAGYILDFYCHEADLVIELDGGHHAGATQAAYDRERTQALEALGLRELRFWNHEVLNQTEAVVQAIVNALIPSPSVPLPEGEGSQTPSPFGRSRSML